jgi:alkylation response protein AidB-like acyl-CoA dehydrogenase
MCIQGDSAPPVTADRAAQVGGPRTVAYPSVRALRRRLVEAARPGGPFSPAALAELDRREAYPDAAAAVLDAAGLHRQYVPVRYGGAQGDFAEGLLLAREVAGHDLTVAIGHGKTFLGGVSVWVAGAADQAAWLGREICAGAAVSWGLTERDHGSDLFAGELTATRTERGWRLDGQKWLINNATRGQLICVLARTKPAGGPRGFGMFCVDKRRLPAGQVEYLPKVRTHGIRGADISGIAFHGAEIPAGALVGGAGDGLLTTLKALQLTRTQCAALSLGAADHGLRLAVAALAAEGRLEAAGRVLGEAAAALLLVEATSLLASRSIQALTAELNVVSAVTKALVPSVVADLLDQLTDLLGSAGFGTDGPAAGAFGKLLRDHPIVGIFDGSTAVCRSALINQFPRLSGGGSWDRAGLATAAALTAPLPALDPGRLGLLSAAGCSVLRGLPDAVARVRELAGHGVLPRRVAELAAEVGAAGERLHQDLAGYAPTAQAAPTSAFDLAARFELCFAGAACLHLWLANRLLPGPLWERGRWLHGALLQVLARLGAAPAEEAADAEVYHLLAGAVSAAGGVSLVEEER